MDAVSTDVSKASPGHGTKYGNLTQSALYDWSEVAYLFDDG